ncbi:MAG TPA: helix-turn-helix domain-containing protein [Gryllotalpicola sp.]
MALAKTAVFGPTDAAAAAALSRLAEALDADADDLDAQYALLTELKGVQALPADARAALAHVARLLAGGGAISIAGVERLLSTSQAAELLGISASYTIRLADEGTLPVEYVGTHRRFRLRDVITAREQREAEAAANPALATRTAAATAARRKK